MKNRIKVYWLLLLVLLYTAGAVLSVGEAQARYTNTATWNTVVQPKDPGVTSDCLEPINDPELFILLGTMPQEGCDIPFTITAGEAVTGKLTWTVDMPDYLSVQMRIGDTVIDPETDVEIEAGDTITVVMTLTPTENAYTEVRDMLNVSIEVIWADTLRGTFLTWLSAVEEEEEPTEETEPETTEPSEPEVTDPSEPETTEPSEPEATEPSEPETTDPSEPEVTEPSEPETTEPIASEPTNPSEPGTSDPTDPIPVEEPDPETGTEAPAQFTPGLFFGLRDLLTGIYDQEAPNEKYTPMNEPSEEPSEPDPEVTEETSPEPTGDTGQQPDDTTDPSEPDSTEPSAAAEDPTEPSAAAEDPTEPSAAADDPTEPSEPTEDPSEPTEDPTEPSEPLQEESPEQNPIVMETPGSINSAASLPIQITTSTSGGPIRLGLVSQTEPAELEGEPETVLENFPRYTRYSLDDGSSYYMLYDEDVIALDSGQGEVLAVLLDLSHAELESSQVTLGAALQEESQIATCDVTLIPESNQWAQVPTRLLTVGQPLEIPISEQGTEFTLEYSLEMLSAIESEDAETETIDYVPVELTEDGLWAELVTGETGTKLVLSIGEKLPQAGTYRITLSWKCEETVCVQIQETIFINYSVYTESEKTGGAEQ